MEVNHQPMNEFGNIKYICVDFDGVFVENHVFPEIGAIKPGVAEAVNRLRCAGVVVIVHTCRTGKSRRMMEEWLREHHIRVDWINENPDCPGADRKPFADMYVDDKGYRFRDWGSSIEDMRRIGAEMPEHRIVHPSVETGNVKRNTGVGGPCVDCGACASNLVSVTRLGNDGGGVTKVCVKCSAFY